ncbi:MAG: AAA family ATPase [Bacteroidales bacterium]
MEENHQQGNRKRRILITGAESTGKSELAASLASHYRGLVVPEYARDYMMQLQRPYTFEDVELIARHQSAAYEKYLDQPGWVFFDTWLIITRVWFDVVFGKVPGWIEDRIRSASFDLILLCDTDIPWVPDPVRENGGAKREALMKRYREELTRYGFHYALVSGSGEHRLDRAIQHIQQLTQQYLPHGKQ